MEEHLRTYFDVLHRLQREALATGSRGEPLSLGEAIEGAVRIIDGVAGRGSKIMFIGNGGSAGIASHAAIDYSKNGRVPALAFSDPAALTCLGNDCGYEHVFAAQVEMHGREGDLLMAISSSGRSPNILKAVDAARAKGCHVIGLSGFAEDNPLRGMGDINFYVASDHYGHVEISHLTFVHAILDMRTDRTNKKLAFSVG